MSLVQDLVGALGIVLDYFGVPAEMLVPVWDSQLCGQYRSIVRMIGTNLPLTPTPRVHFEIPLIGYRMPGYVDVTMDTTAIPSFADVLWVLDEEGDNSARTRNHLWSNKQIVLDQRRCSARPPTQVQRGRTMMQISDPNALKKISALERELLQLRAQIATIVTTTDVTQSNNTAREPSPLTSTPRCPPPPPPPPPPLPPPITTSSSEISSVLELIQQCRKNENDLGKGQLKPQDSRASRVSHDKAVPSMLDVLKDLNQVKLRSVKRSPGGSPVKRRRSRGTVLHNDPASLIAEALKRKFSQYRHNNSSDKENSLELSPFSSPDTPKVPQHVRRSQGRRHF